MGRYPAVTDLAASVVRTFSLQDYLVVYRSADAFS
jgi:hypothetical protein